MLKKLHFLVITTTVGCLLHAQICPFPSASAELNIGNVRAGLLNDGTMWNNGVDASRYEFPKVDTSLGQLSKNALFAGGIWLSARDNSNNLKVAAMTNSIHGRDFYSGPIDNNTGTTTFSDCNFFDRFWEIYASEIAIHLNNVNQGLPVPLSSIPSNVLNWPAKGNANISSYNITQDLAPFVDYNGNGIYDPINGDYPETIGDQSFFWVINDIGGPHFRSDGDPLEVEVQFLAHAFESPTSPLFNSTVYEVKVINKSFGNLSDLRFGLFVDPDLGNATDDYVGCDTLRDAGFVYNGNAVDPIYGSNPPVISFQYLNQELESFIFFINAGINNDLNDPGSNNTAQEIDYLLHGLSIYGNSFDLIPYIASQSSFIYPGNPDLNGPYSMNPSSYYAGTDFRTMQSTGTANFPAWTSFDVSFAINATYTNNYQPDSFYFQVQNDLDSVEAAYSALKSTNIGTSLKGIGSSNNEIFIYPNPADNQIQIVVEEQEILEIQIVNTDGKLIKMGNSSIIDITDLASGIYFVKVKTKEGVGMKKMIKN